MKILNKIACSNDVKSVEEGELKTLCEEIRSQLIEDVSKTGGHLASNLGVVELTVALHRVYDTEKDRLVFDVGHQCYAHKMLTGRLGDFPSLRSFGGISGFPKPSESINDACISGHASTSVSNALGMARARSILHEDYDVVVMIGDGAMTGGLSYEGLSDCGASGEGIVVILNDNAMSIGSNVGGIAKLISDARVKPSYISFKRAYRKTLLKLPSLYKFIHFLKEKIKDFFLPDNMFEDLGFYYLGPVDGHDVRRLEAVLEYAKSLEIPVLLHVVTTKGKGYEPAEKAPDKYHGVSAFDAAVGITSQCKPCFSEVFGKELTRLAGEDATITAITAAMESGTGLVEFEKEFPDRWFDVGIAEGHAVSLAAGMAKQGLKPVFAVYSTFLQRAYDMLIHDVALGNLPVVIGVDRAGIVGCDGETHNGSFDVAFLSSVPNLKIFSPSSFAELRSMLSLALEQNSPVAIRYPRGAEGEFRDDTSGKRTAVLQSGDFCTIVSYGITINDALIAAKSLEKMGKKCEIIKLNELSNSDLFPILESVKKTKRLVVVEECCKAGCLGERVLSFLAQSAVTPENARLLNLGDGVVGHGDTKIMRQKCGIDADAIAAAIMKF